MESVRPPAPEIVSEKSATQNRPTNAVMRIQTGTHSLSGLFSFLAFSPGQY
jgi:hypothetical protein